MPPGWSKPSAKSQRRNRGDGDCTQGYDARPKADAVRAASGRDRYLQHPVALVGEQVVGHLDLVELESMRDHRFEIDTS